MTERLQGFIPLLFILMLLPGLLFAQSFQVEAYRAAHELQRQGRYFAAVEAYTELARVYPSYVDPIAGLAESFFMLGEYEDALIHVNRAITLKRQDPSLMVLKGRILVGADRIDEAAELFEMVLRIEPNNIEARLGRAELNVAAGDVGDAMETYSRTLELVPNERRALLGLVILYDALERFDVSETYVNAAVRYHGDNPQVQVALAQHYLKLARFEDALYHAQLAISLKPDYRPALISAAQVHLEMQEFSDAVTQLRTALSLSPDDPEILYTLGTAYARMSETEQAIRAYTAVFRSRRDDELARYALEQLVKEKTGTDYPLRKSLADYHMRRGAEFRERFLLNKALREYRLAVQMVPDEPQYRLRYAEIYKTLGYPAKYLSELEVIANEGLTNRDIEDELEIQRSLQESDLSRSWGVDQFALERSDFEIGIYLINGSSSMIHFAAELVTGELLVNILSGEERLAVADRELKQVSSYAEAFRSARTAGQDYFSIVNFQESERSFTVRLELYLGANGKLLNSYKLFRTGNDRIIDSISGIAEELRLSLPLQARLLARQFNTGLIDLGRFDGLELEAELLIIRAGEVSLRRDGIGFAYAEADVVGSFTVTALDELVAQGEISKKGFFDYVNEGDLLVLPAETPSEPANPEGTTRGLYKEILTIQ